MNCGREGWVALSKKDRTDVLFNVLEIHQPHTHARTRNGLHKFWNNQENPWNEKEVDHHNRQKVVKHTSCLSRAGRTTASAESNRCNTTQAVPLSSSDLSSSPSRATKILARLLLPRFVPLETFALDSDSTVASGKF